jgi:hypothetical protein
MPGFTTRWSLAVFAAAFLGAAAAADPKTAAEALGGTFDPATGAAVVKKNKAVTPQALADLGATGRVKSLTLDGCGLKSDGVAALAGMTQLTGLNLTHTMVNKLPDLEALAKIESLEELDLGGSNFGDAGLAAVAKLKNLTTLSLGHVGRDDKNCFTADGLKALSGLPNLRRLTLHLHRPDDAMIPVLAGLPMVSELSVGGISKDYLAKLQAAMPKAKVKLRGQPVEPR